jgi:aldehyde dehydrogenase (NAD+)
MTTAAQTVAGKSVALQAAAPHVHDGEGCVWTTNTVAERVAILRAIRHRLAEGTEQLLAAVPASLARNRADTLAAEILPLLEACRFLEREAEAILAPRRLGRRGLPFWLAGIDGTIERVPLGAILIVAPSNYPLFLPGVQALQALAAGNSVVWKPGAGGSAIAQVFAGICADAGLPSGVLRVTGESIEAATEEIEAKPAKIVFTGSAYAGRAVQRLAAELSIPVVAELSGCDAVIALPNADPKCLADALCFGMRLNGSATCMAPRRLILIGDGHEPLVEELRTRFAAMDAVSIGDGARTGLSSLLAEAQAQGATVLGGIEDGSLRPILVLGGSPGMALVQADIFAPVLTVIAATDAVETEQQCPFGLTAAIFGDESEARQLASQLTVGTVTINDLIVPTADPRVPFGGRKASGFGTTRGAEGLLEMTAVRTISARRGNDRKHFQPTGPAHEELFTGVALMTHAATWKTRLAGLQRMIAAARKL